MHLSNGYIHAPSFFKSGAGFTLIELLVVISIIAILATIGTAVYSQSQKAARDARRREDLHSIQTALETYHATNGKYPTGGFGSCDTGGTSAWQNLVNILAPNTIPSDPINTYTSATLPEAYCYYYTSNQGPITPATYISPDNYVLGARLESAPYSDSSCPGKYYNFCPGTGCTGYHDAPSPYSSGLSNFYGACSVNYVILGK